MWVEAAAASRVWLGPLGRGRAARWIAPASTQGADSRGGVRRRAEAAFKGQGPGPAVDGMGGGGGSGVRGGGVGQWMDGPRPAGCIQGGAVSRPARAS